MKISIDELEKIRNRAYRNGYAAAKALEDKYGIKDETSGIPRNEEYKWHDLKKNPADLPKPYRDVLICLSDDPFLDSYVIAYRDDFKNAWWNAYDKTQISRKAIAWRRIERFETEK